MRTGSLRGRIVAATMTLFTVVLAGVIAAVTLLYRASLDDDLRQRLTAAASAMEQTWPAGEGKQLAFTLALQGIATDVGTEPVSGAGMGTGVAQRYGSLLVLRQVLPDGTRIAFSASEEQNDRAVRRLLAIELAVAFVALLAGSFAVRHAATTALEPLTAVAASARRIASGDRSHRLRPSRTDTQLGGMAAAFDQMMDALEAAIHRAERAEATMRAFLADASHELRSPVAALQATAELLLREQPERPERDVIEASLARDASRVGRLIDDLLGLAGAEALRSFGPVDVNAVVLRVVGQTAGRADQVRITTDLCQDANVDGDPDALGRLLRNLVDNALVAIPSENGSVHLAVQRAADRVRVEVSDNGPGIPDHERERVFERFVRLGPHTPGHGLGLAIARRIACAHGGDLICRPSDAGAVFVLDLPRGELVTRAFGGVGTL